jgi:hypothetical protein
VLFQAAIRWKCAFTYMNAVSRKNLTDARVQLMRQTWAPRSPASAFGGVTDIAPSRRMIVTCMWGVSDPLRAGRGAKKGAAKWGSLTPYRPLCSDATAAPTRDRRHRTPPAADVKPQTGKKMERP